jgi:hypothetical protein
MSLWVAVDIFLMIIGGIGMMWFLGAFVYIVMTNGQIVDPSSGSEGIAIGMILIAASVGIFLLGFLPERQRIAGFLKG